MAKGARSSRLKANKTKLRTNVFNKPIEERMMRLSQKQQATSSEPLERKERAMEVDGEAVDEPNTKDDHLASTAMEVDGVEGSLKKRKVSKTSYERRAERKLRHKKVRNMITFPVKRKSTRRQPRI